MPSTSGSPPSSSSSRSKFLPVTDFDSLPSIQYKNANWSSVELWSLSDDMARESYFNIGKGIGIFNTDKSHKTIKASFPYAKSHASFPAGLPARAARTRAYVCLPGNYRLHQGSHASVWHLQSEAPPPPTTSPKITCAFGVCLAVLLPVTVLPP
ncbi:hypothetical protein BDA99DRAFT_602030 [Phascolomyces articulosus]|uniref:Uncharacterized protein n=1 Tax=Phascolomyces articulosus TaxID=60185 RepID=A0AAD5PHF8_9FUNG|nr:hypothetical protein BDA99DRAFT_602030 [Phascolomyces articulosus]